MAPGKWPNAIGTIREFSFLSDAGFSIEGDGHAFNPRGFVGGAEGHVAVLTLVDPDGSQRSALQGALCQGEGGRAADLDRTLRWGIWRPDAA